MNRLLKLVFAVLIAGCGLANAPGQIYVVYYHAGVVSKYDADTGAVISDHFLLGLNQPRALCLANGVLYVLQSGDGTIGKYDAQTGATINDRFISGLNLPQAMTVAGDELYVASFAWEANQAIIGKYNAFTGATINSSFIKTSTEAAGLAVSGHKLYVAASEWMAFYDTTSGAMLRNHFAPFANEPFSLATSENSLWITNDSNAPYGAVFKIDVDTYVSGIGIGMGFLHPLIDKLDHPSLIAVSGDDLFLGGTGGTGIAKYNATTGEMIKAVFIPSLGDRFGGLAVVPRAPSAANAMADAKFAEKNAILNFELWVSVNGSYLELGAALLAALAAVLIFAMFFIQKTTVNPETATVETSPEAEPVAPPEEGVPPPPSTVEEEPILAEPSTQARSMSALTVVILSLVVLTVALGLFLGWLDWQNSRYQTIATSGTSDLIGWWRLDNDLTRQGDEEPVLRFVQIYPNRLEYSAGSGTLTTPGQWRDNGFWCQKPDGSGEVEVARITNPEELELHLSVFDPRNPEVDSLYKLRGNDAEMRAMAARYPPPYTYPPPAGVIKFWMSEYELTNLPWKAYEISPTGDDPYSRGTLYIFRSDNPHLDKLEVTVKNHRVVLIKGGNG